MTAFILIRLKKWGTVDTRYITSNSSVLALRLRVMTIAKKADRQPDESNDARDADKVDEHVALFPLLLHLYRWPQPSPSRPDMLVYVLVRLSMLLVVEVEDAVALVLLAGAKAAILAVAVLTRLLATCAFTVWVGIRVLGSLCAVAAIAPGLVEGGWGPSEGAAFLIQAARGSGPECGGAVAPLGNVVATSLPARLAARGF